MGRQREKEQKRKQKMDRQIHKYMDIDGWVDG